MYWSIGILCVGIRMVKTAQIAIDLRLCGRARIRHGYIVSTGSCISNRAILWCVLRTSVGIGRV